MKMLSLNVLEIGCYLEEIILLVDNNSKNVCYSNKDAAYYFASDTTLFHQSSNENDLQKESQISLYFYNLAYAAATNETRFQTVSTNEIGEKVTIEWKSIHTPSKEKEEKTTILLIGKDISDDCNKKERIDDLEMQLNSVIEVMAGNYWWKDVNGVYKGFNKALLDLLGVSREDVVGHTDYDLPWANTADELAKNDQLVISSGLPHKTEEEIKSSHGEIRIFDIFKIPLKNKKGEIIGTIGNSIDITERKRAEAKAKIEADEAHRLKLEIEYQQIAIEEKEKFVVLARKVAHDISSPLASIKMMMDICDELPEKKRTILRKATENIFDITNNFLNDYVLVKNSAPSDIEPRQPLLISDQLIQLLSEKKVQYRDRLITFDTTIANAAHFAFAYVQAIEFRRSMSNLINNAVDALEENNNGMITIQLNATDDTVFVEINDNGKGMTLNMIEKMQNRQSFTENKKNGHGLGLQQVWDTLNYNQGTMEVRSILGKGTSIKLTLPRATAPDWIAQEIHLTPDSIIVILDDDESIHTAWNLRFTPLLATYPNLRLQHFTQGQGVLDFLASLSQEEKNRVFLLSDYELLHQNRNGLEIIEASEIKHAILVTSYYSKPKIQETANRLEIKVLPKLMAPIIPIYVNSDFIVIDASVIN